jgi:hypothetical protein
MLGCNRITSWADKRGPLSQSASAAAAFYRDVAKLGVLWTVRDGGGFPAPKTRTGQRAQPFWSSRSRAEKIISTVPAYRGSDLVEITWEEFCRSWVSKLTKAGVLVGVNWSGPGATGYDLDVDWIVRCVTIEIENRNLSA